MNIRTGDPRSLHYVGSPQAFAVMTYSAFDPTEEFPFIQKAIEDRRVCYQASLRSRDGLSERSYRKELARFDKILDACRSPLPRLSPLDRAVLLGCIQESLVDPLDEVRQAMAKMSDPQWYAYVKEHKAEIAHQQSALALWNKLKDRKEEAAFLPLTKWEFFEQIRSTERVYCSFSGATPYKLALWLPGGNVLRLDLDDERNDLRGPIRGSDHDLRNNFTHMLSPLDFCTVLQRYGKERPLNAWHRLLMELLGGPITVHQATGPAHFGRKTRSSMISAG